MQIGCACATWDNPQMHSNVLQMHRVIGRLFVKDSHMPRKPKTHRSYVLKSTHKSGSLSNARDIRASYRWTKYSMWMRGRYPMCQFPADCKEISTSVHHIQSLERRPDLAFVESNTIPVCEGHHGWCNEQETHGHSTYHKFSEWRDKINNREIVRG